ncbi:MAG: hypothetical protein OZ919_02180 [Xanthomonadaceae bacterium]|nr:hypothetical protein [Xanthomonadaceae bacterium]
MKRFHVAALALLLALPIIAHAQIQVPPADELGAIAWNSMAARSGEQALPALRRSSVERTIHTSAPGGTLSVTFGAQGGETTWTLRGYAWQRDVPVDEAEVAAPEAATSGNDAPENPDPAPPTHHGTPGDTSTNVFQLGQWRYTVKYSYGVREGVLGWHVDSIESIYNPTPPPGPIYYQEK